MVLIMMSVSKHVALCPQKQDGLLGTGIMMLLSVIHNHPHGGHADGVHISFFSFFCSFLLLLSLPTVFYYFKTQKGPGHTMNSV